MEININYRGFTLDPFQVQAIQQIEGGNSLVVSAPTGSGKTLIAEYLIEKVLQTDRRIIYTSPIKALSNQKYRDFSLMYGERIGILTGDVVINREAQVLIMTTEVYRNMAVEDPDVIKDVSYVIFDEIHFLGDIERGTVWEEAIIFSPKTVKFLALSATIPNCEEFARWIESVVDHKVSVISSDHRSVPLSHLFYFRGKLLQLKELHRQVNKTEDSSQPTSARGEKKSGEKDSRTLDIVKILRAQDRLPLLYFAFSRSLVDHMARETSHFFDFTNKAEKARIIELADGCIDKYGLHNLESALELKDVLVNGVGKHRG
ncbi:DEAD/DEAH box helicase [bacterium]|nr:DEAD/DEAH box helicase [bacterium]